MSLISVFINKLIKPENSDLRNFVEKQLFYCQPNSKEKKLYDILTQAESDNLSDEELSLKIYNSKNNTATLRVLRTRLFHKILDCLSREEFIGKDKDTDDVEKTSIRLRKKLIAYRIMLNQKNADLKEISDHLLNEIIDEAKKILAYPVLIEALTFKKYRINLRDGLENFNILQKQIENYLACYLASCKANDYYHTLIISQNFISILSKEEHINQLTFAITDLENEYAKTGAIDVLYFLSYLKLELVKYTKNYENAIDVCLEMINMMRNFPVLFKNERIGYIHDNLAQHQVYIGEYENAIDTIKEAQKYYKANSFALLISQEQEFYANFYAQKYTRAAELCDIMLQHPKSDTGEFRHDKIIYYSACTDFAIGNYNRALKKCSQSLEIRKDKAGWEVSLRILNIMCQIELGYIDGAMASIDALRKHLSRNKNKYPIRQRDELIYKALCEFEKTGFECYELNPRSEKILSTLSLPEGIYSWQIYSPELIPFQEWLEKRICSTVIKPELLNKQKRFVN